MTKIKNKIIRKSLVCALLLFMALTPAFTLAAVMSSENYQMGTSVIGSGVSGALETQSSENYTIEYPWRDTISASSQDTSAVQATMGGSVIGAAGAAKTPTHINSFNVPLVIDKKQSGTLTYDFPGDKSIVVDAPKGVASKRITIVMSAERLSEANEYLIPWKTYLLGGIFWNITARDADGNLVRQFDKYITVTLQIPDLLIGEKNLGVYFLDESAGEWILVPDAVFTEKTAVFRVNHLTKFAVFRREETLDEFDVLIPRGMLKPLPSESGKTDETDGPVKVAEARDVDIVKPEGPAKTERLFDASSDAGSAKRAETKEENRYFVWEFWALFFVLTVIVLYFMRGKRRKV